MNLRSSFSLFQIARVKLTAWYVLLILIISVAFSVGIYEIATSELDRFDQQQQRRLENKLKDPFVTQLPEDIRSELERRLAEGSFIDESKRRIRLTLLLLNLGILISSGSLGYFLAGRTLRPIDEMVKQQNQFISDASHELKTPLTALKTELEVNLRDKNLSLPESKKLLQSNLEEVNSLVHLSESLLTLSQNHEQKNYSSPVNIIVNELVEAALKKVIPLAKDKKIIFENKTGKESFYGQFNSLKDCLVILLDNAIKYSQKETKITINSGRTDGMIYLSIADQGIGIAKKELPFIFNRFYRSDISRTKNNTKGFGLGLSIAKKIIVSHNGKISVKSVENKGTTFTIYLPKNYNT